MHYLRTTVSKRILSQLYKIDNGTIEAREGFRRIRDIAQEYLENSNRESLDACLIGSYVIVTKGQQNFSGYVDSWIPDQYIGLTQARRIETDGNMDLITGLIKATGLGRLENQRYVVIGPHIELPAFPAPDLILGCTEEARDILHTTSPGHYRLLKVGEECYLGAKI